MADEALEPASTNPFDELAQNDNQPMPVASPGMAQKPQNEFDAIGPDLGEGSSTTGAFGRAAARGALPAIGAFPAIGAGAELGATVGSVAGPIGTVAGGLVGGLAGGLVGGAAVSAAQDWAISKLPDSWQEALGQDDRQRKLDEQQHGTAAFLGGMLPTVLTMKPGIPSKVPLRENATALERIMSYPATAAVFGGGVMGGMELGQELAHGEIPNWTHVAVATGVGVVFNRTTGFGERLIETGAHPARRALGRAGPTVAAPTEPGTPETTPAATPEGTSPIEHALAGAPERPANVTEKDWNETILGQKAPTVFEAADAKVMGPGVTESVFMGTQEQSPSAALTSQQAVRNERIALGENSTVPDVQQTARTMEPELFERYEALRSQQEDFRRWIAETEETGGAPAAAAHLKAIEAELEAIGPEVRAAHRRAADAVGGETTEPPVQSIGARETISGSPGSLVRPIEEQRNFIARDVEQKLIAAGRSPEEALAAGHLVAARYETRAGRFGGKLGDAQDLYLREGPEIVGPNGKAVATRTPPSPAAPALPELPPASASPRPEVRPAARGPAARPVEKWSLLEYLAHNGGISPTDPLIGDLRGSIGTSNKFVPGFGHIIRRGGMTLDQAREAAVEGGYISRSDARTDNTTIRTLLDAMDGELRGRKVYRQGEEGSAQANRDDHLHAIETEIDHALQQVEIDPKSVPDKTRARVLEIMDREGERDPLLAYERAVMEQDLHAVETEKLPPIEHEIPGWSSHDAGAASREGEANRAGESGTGEAARDGGAGNREARELAQGSGVTETPEFKNWFGYSKVVDADGKPEVVFHGTARGGFDEFDTYGSNYGLMGQGSYFTENPTVASTYTDKGRKKIERGGGETSTSVYPVYLNIKKPIDMDAKANVAAWEKSARDYLEAEHLPKDATNEQVLRHIEESLEDERLPKYEGAEIVQNIIRDMGFDGITHIGGGRVDSEGVKHRVWIAFDPEQIKSATGNTGAFDPNSPRIFEQGARGKIRIAEGRKPIITLMKDANASTFVHESGHQWLEELMRDSYHPEAPSVVRDDAQTVRDWLGVKDPEDIKTKHHEKFARGFEQYVREGIAPSPQLAGVFARFKDWLVSIYQTLKGLGAPINDDIRGVFDRMIAMEPQRTVVAPERAPTGPTIHDIHETEARDLTPAEAAPAADRVAAETDRFAAELTPEVKNELEAKIDQIEREIEARAAASGAEPAGETGAGAGEGPAVGPSSGKPGALTAGGDSGAESGKVSESGGGVAAEGPKPVDTGNPLAPGPTQLFGAEQSPYLDKAGNIRLDTLTTVEGARQAIRDAAAANQDFIGDRRGVVTDGQVMDVARAAGMEGAEKLVHERIKGQAFSAEEVMTLRLALVQSATSLSATMKKAAIGTDVDVMAYAQAKDRHQLLQATVAQATAEAGRALRAFRNITGMEGGAKTADLFAREATGKTLFQLRQEAKLGATLETPEQVSKFMQDAQKRTFGHMMVEYWINGLLSGPATHSTNIIGNLILSLQHMGPETAAAAGIGAVRRAFGREGETIKIGEVGARVRGLVEGIPSGLQAAGESFKAGVNMLLPGEEARALPFQHNTDLAPRPRLNEAATYGSVMADTFGAVQGMRDGIIAAGAVLKGGVEGAPLLSTQYGLAGAIPDIAVKGVNILPVGTVARLPGRFLSAADGFFRAVNYSMEKNARAYRMASEEGLSGTKFDARVADIRQNPTEAMMAEMVGESSRLTLMDKGGKFLAALTHLSNVEIGGFPALKFVTPFVHVAGNILKQAVIERTPLGIFSPELRADLMGKNGTVAQDMAQARMLLGTGLAVTMGTLAAQGLASGSGPTDPNDAAMWRLAGNQAHSVRIGDTWYSVQKLGPMGLLMGIAADMWDVSKSASEGEMSEAASHVIHAFSQNVIDQSVMKGPSELLRAVNDSDRYGSQYVRNFLSAFVPYSVGMQQMSRVSDPYSRQARTVVDAIRSKIPGHLDSYFENPLFPKIDIWGQPMLAPETIGGPGITGINQRTLSTDPVNVALLELGISPAPVSRKIRNVDLTDQQFDEFARKAGVMTKQRLDVIVNSPDWRTWPNYAKTLVVEETVKQSREVARGLMMGKYKQIAVDAVEAKMDKYRD